MVFVLLWTNDDSDQESICKRIKQDNWKRHRVGEQKLIAYVAGLIVLQQFHSNLFIYLKQFGFIVAYI